MFSVSYQLSTISSKTSQLTSDYYKHNITSCISNPFKMAAINQIKVNLGKPLRGRAGAHDCFHVHQGTDAEALTISFQRTIRVPDNNEVHNLPPDLGNFPLYNVSHFKDNMPEGMALKGGAFMPVHDREGLWVGFESTRPFAIKLYLGGINAISGEPIIETFATPLRRAKLLEEKKAIQNYVVVDPANQGQLWLDGIAKLNGKVMQFVAVPSGSGYSVESQISSNDAVGGIQISVTPVKPGETISINIKRLNGSGWCFEALENDTVYKLMLDAAKHFNTPVEQFYLLFNSQRLDKRLLLSHYGVKFGSNINLVLNLTGGGAIQNPSFTNSDGEMSIGAGGLIQQSILADPHPKAAWDVDQTAMFNVQLLNADAFYSVTGMRARPSPITAATYAAAGLPFYSLPTEKPSGIKGIFSDIKSVAQLDVTRKRKRTMDKKVKFRTVELDPANQIPFRSVADLIAAVTGLGIYHFD
ncbi:hypothetical protein LSUE1_G008321 [Lachnellula suecica]|uniref:Ubiquitin-like domain-containing protein n=1 Tax=Lachnellula suecica TaxID=602035 RepID=A0A8T9C334_9HELO|nr:hypothetical protein LSUE1_G008321 [Lachnellula suecica]